MGTRSGFDGILFDFDGTLTAPAAIDFEEIRQAVGCPRSLPILEYIQRLEDHGARTAAMATLHRFELAAARRSQPNLDAETVVRVCRDRLGLPLGILTRNSREAVITALAGFRQVAEADFAMIVTRDDALPPKPHPAGVLAVAARLGVPPARLLVVGDYRFDIEAGQAAGAVTALLTNGSPQPDGAAADFTLGRLGELLSLPRLWPKGTGSQPFLPGRD